MGRTDQAQSVYFKIEAGRWHKSKSVPVNK